MLDKDFVNSVLDLVSDKDLDVIYEAQYDDCDYPTEQDKKSLIDSTDLDKLKLTFSIPTTHDFEMKVFGDYIESEFDELPVSWGFFDVSLSLPEVINMGEIERFLDEIVAIKEYTDFSEIDGYYDEYYEEFESALNDHGLSDFVSNLVSFIHTLYPLANLDDLSDYEDSEWVRELFNECLNYEFIEGNTIFCFDHDFVANEQHIIDTLKEHYELDLSAYTNDIPSENFTDFGGECLYLAMELKDFTLTQLANIVYLQNNKTWSDNNLIFISGYGFYIKVTKYSYKVIETMHAGELFSFSTLKEIANKLAKNKTSWWKNWQAAIRALKNVEGLESFSKHYSHDDKYDYAAKNVFFRLVSAHPDLCNLSGNWWRLFIDTKIIPDKHRDFDRYERPLNEYLVTFDFGKALDNEAKIFPSFKDSLVKHCLALFDNFDKDK